MRSHQLAIALLSASCVAAALADSPQRPAPAQTLIDFTAVGEDGRPVLDLASKEMTLEVGGRQRHITSFRRPRADGPAASALAVDPPFATNIITEAMGRDVLVVIDEESISPGNCL